jgi:hypothetical protein
MNQIHNKHGPDYDVGFLMSGRQRDGTVGNPRDGTVGNPRDGTVGNPRDGTQRRPRDETMLRKDSLVISYYTLLTKQPQDVRIHGRPPSKWRKTGWSRPASGTGKGEVCPEVNGKRNEN